MELHRRFGENKFIIVVPSRAIKAGVEDSLNKMRDYLSDIHNTDKYRSFVYDSKQVSHIQTFANSNFDIMLTTIQAFNSGNNVINQEYSEGFFGGKPLEIIQEANPIVIIDEPQSVDATDAGKKAIASLNPKVVLRYSATHKDKQYPLLYQFGPVQAYNGDGEKRYVKQIETLGTEVDTDGNIPVVELKGVEFKNGVLQAKVVAYKETEEDYIKKSITLKQNEYLAIKTKNSRYDVLGKVVEINSRDNFVEFENGHRIEIAQVEGENEIWLTSQITALIRDHLDRELRLQSQGIKVLSLIFLDSVENYRIYKDDSTENGEYAKLFESIYTSVLNSNPKYKTCNDYTVPVSEVHDGYFAMDKATKNNPAKYKDTMGDTQSDETAYEVIMADKEGLLTQYVPNKPETDTKASKLRFIFSHSALKEGWDNPNVFQILTITAPKSDLTRRQKIGRGLRICVNQKGERVYGEHNIVTIYANETFEEFAAGLQKEYLESGLLTNKIPDDFFAGLLIDKSQPTGIITDENFVEQSIEPDIDDQERVKNTVEVTPEDSSKFVRILRENRVIKKDDTVSPRAIKELNKKDFENKIVTEFVSHGGDEKIVKAMVENLKVKFNVPEPTNRKNRTLIEITDKENEYFKDLWDKISHKVNYRVKFRERELIDNIVDGNNSIVNIQISKMTATQTRARIGMMTTRLTSEVTGKRTEKLTWADMPIIDVTRQIADKVGLTRKAIIEIIRLATEKDDQFMEKIKQNPALFVRRAINNIQIHQRSMLNKSLVYVQTGELWSDTEFKPYEAADNTLWQVPTRGFIKTLFKQLVVDSNEERSFADSLVNEEKIKYFLKLPHWFKIPTPFGNYNPDWAILAETDSSSKLYFVVDTKTTREKGNLAPADQDKLNAGEQAYIEGDVKFQAPVKVIGDLQI